MPRTDYPTIDIYAGGIYVASTTQSATLAEAVDRFVGNPYVATTSQEVGPHVRRVDFAGKVVTACRA